MTGLGLNGFAIPTFPMAGVGMIHAVVDGVSVDIDSGMKTLIV